MGKHPIFFTFCCLNDIFDKMTRFFYFSLYFAKEIHKMYKITFDFHDMRKILKKFFWSHGTRLGYLGPGSREALGPGSYGFQILVIWGPNDLPVLLVFHVQAKNLNTAGCDIDYR